MSFLTGLLIGVLGAIVLVPLCLFIYHKIKDTKERRLAKQLLAQGKFLKPMDKKDYDVKMWEKEIIPATSDELNSLKKIFDKPQEVILEEEN